MQRDLTNGKITVNILLFALPLMVGNLLQQMYNIADTWVVGRYIGEGALAAVGSSYSLMTFLTSIIIGLCMGSGTAISIQYGRRESGKMRQSVYMSFVLIITITILLNIIVWAGMNVILTWLNIPADVRPLMKDYLNIIYAGILAVFLYNYFANILRAIGNSTLPVVFLAISAVLNIALDLMFVIAFHWGVRGAAAATVIAQYVSAIGMAAYVFVRCPELKPTKSDCVWDRENLSGILSQSVMTSVQQSIMNLGILMVQGIVNGFGTVVMAAFAAAVKIDAFAYMPVQDFGNAFSTYVAQNYGAGKTDRIKKGIKSSLITVAVFCAVISSVIFAFAGRLMEIFVGAEKTDVISVGAHYLQIEGACYIGIGILFMLYGYYRAIDKPWMSVVLTVASLGTRVVLAYTLSRITFIGVTGIWVSVPIGWALADVIGCVYYVCKCRKTY